MNPALMSSTDLGTLSQSLGVTVEQMVLNRGGAVSPDQMRGFGWLVLRNAVMVLVVVGASFIIAAVVKVWWRWISVAILVALATFFSVRAIGEIRDLLAPQSLSVEGKPKFFGGYRNTVTMRIGGKDFTFNTDVPEEKKPWNLIQTERTYRVYFLRHSGRPLSMEPSTP